MKYDLITVKRNEVFTDSKVIANGTHNKHESIQRIINKYKDDFEEFGKLRFSDLKSENPKGGRPEVIYLLNEEQATLLMTYLRNNEAVRTFKKNLVHQFYRMRRHLLEKQSKAWIETRENNKKNRLKETDVIKLLIEYAKEQGSRNSDKLYITYTKLANTIINCKRDQANIMQLNNLTLVEGMILQTIRIDMSLGMHYKDIYKDCKTRIEMFKDITYLNNDMIAIN
ncbi:Rha family transcriptional regulator [Terrisporobacter sp.]|uniref:Rha family transcriptional regulator n=1 Tax=Terrisporobacter sp. TaxID=1965305 RepID=UPI00261E28B9|nr:Rha family transcriptional regulator [Terrisporobacter sp.]